MLDYNEIYIILNSYSYNERSLNVYDNKTNMQITNINDILKIKSAFFINEYYKMSVQKLFKKDPVQK